VDAYLTKPFDPAEMIRVVRELAGAPGSAFD
jgi:DNA-binding response OmpR family regulator